MNIRFDAHSIRIRVTQEEALRLRNSEILRETYPFGGLSLEVRTTKDAPLSFELSSERCFRVSLPELALGESMIKSSINYLDSEIDLIFEIDLFKPSRRKNDEPRTEP